MANSEDRKSRLARTFGSVNPERLAQQAAQNKDKHRSNALPTRALKTSMSAIEARVLELQNQLDQTAFKEIDPALIRGSVISDRFPWTEESEDFLALKQSIQEEGQKLPILVRPHPKETGCYQVAYGARRAHACRVLGMPVKAFVQDLSDDDLIVAQGIENNERSDLSFIEKALYAQSLSNMGYSQAVIARAIGIKSRQNIPRFLRVAKIIPVDICHLIGPAENIGSPRWNILADHFLAAGEKAQQAIVDASTTKAWIKADSPNKRFEVAFKVAAKAAAGKGDSAKRSAQVLFENKDGAHLVKMADKSTVCSFSIDKKIDPEFARFLSDRMKSLIAEYEAGKGDKQ